MKDIIYGMGMIIMTTGAFITIIKGIVLIAGYFGVN